MAASGIGKLFLFIFACVICPLSLVNGRQLERYKRHAVDNDLAFVIASADYVMPKEKRAADKDKDDGAVKGLEMTSFGISSKIVTRFATTTISNFFKNFNEDATDVSFSVNLPEEAFITEFNMVINNKTIYGQVKEKEEAKAVFDAALAAGESAGLVAQSPRRTNSFRTSVNVAAKEKVMFHLTYQEILTRSNGYYKHVINVSPGQIVKEMHIKIDVEESSAIKDYHVPKIAKDIGDKTVDELLKMSDWSTKLDAKETSTKDKHQLSLGYSPNTKTQKEFTAKGIDGQLVLLYDVERPDGGELKVVDGYFVHFFAPKIAKPLPKNVIFVIDRSGSMGEGAKMQQTLDAMNVILRDLDAEDYFNIVRFDDVVEKWKDNAEKASADARKSATIFVNETTSRGGTNINDALVMALLMMQESEKTLPKSRFQSTIIFLTDGQATNCETSTEGIIKNIKLMQRKESPAVIHSISFGDGADFGLLQKISARNGGLARKVYQDSDAALQLHGFYSEISHPLLTKVSIKYLNETVKPESVLSSDETYYKGGEIVVVGKLKDKKGAKKGDTDMLEATVEGFGAGESAANFHQTTIIEPWPCLSGPTGRPCWWPIDPPIMPSTTAAPLPAQSVGGFVERMWAYKTIKGVLKQAEAEVDDEEAKKKLKARALELSLKYGFVTELTSMVVVVGQKDDKKTLATEAKPNQSPQANMGAFAGSISAPAGPWPRQCPAVLPDLPDRRHRPLLHQVNEQKQKLKKMVKGEQP